MVSPRLFRARLLPALPSPSRRGLRRVGTVLAALLVPLGAAPAAVAAARTSTPAAMVRAPFGGFDALAVIASGVRASGWAVDPDARTPTVVELQVDGKLAATTPASAARADVAAAYPQYGSKHGFSRTLDLRSGAHRVCAVIRNTGTGPATVSLGCRSVTVTVSAFGYLESVAQAPNGISVVGWAADSDTAGALAVSLSVNGVTKVRLRASTARPDVAAIHPALGAGHGFNTTFYLPAGTYQVCAVAENVGAGRATTSLGCRAVTVDYDPVGSTDVVTRATGSSVVTVSGWAVDPETSAPATVRLNLDGRLVTQVVAGQARPGFRPPFSWVGLNHGFRVTLTVDQRPHTVCPVAANRGRGKDRALVCRPIAGHVAPLPSPYAAQTTPALISTSRYIRNIYGDSGDAAKTRAMGATDATNNPSNHRYMILLQIGGQSSNGIELSTTSTFVSYGQTVSALRAYLDGYASRQHVNAPVMIAIGTNNDMTVSRSTGIIWAQQVVNPLQAYAAKYPGITMAGANDIEPGFIGSPQASMDWVAGYLAATTAKFVFNGSADGCGTGVSGTICNNGWTASVMQWVSGGASPTRIYALPQIYNHDMPWQWKYISLTGVLRGKPHLSVAGPLTEWTACVAQSGGCGSLTNNDAWASLWNSLQSDSRVSQPSLPYGTDLRVN